MNCRYMPVQLTIFEKISFTHTTFELLFSFFMKSFYVFIQIPETLDYKHTLAWSYWRLLFPKGFKKKSKNVVRLILCPWITVGEKRKLFPDSTFHKKTPTNYFPFYNKRHVFFPSSYHRILGFLAGSVSVNTNSFTTMCGPRYGYWVAFTTNSWIANAISSCILQHI